MHTLNNNQPATAQSINRLIEKSKNSHPAFTMIELIVVIGIIGILMAVLLGTFSGSTESARSAKCLSNMRNLAMAVQSVGMASGCYPYAGTFQQYYYDKDSSGKLKRKVRQSRGWIGWSTDADDQKGSYIGTYDGTDAERYISLSNGTLLASMKGGRSAFVCPSHKHAKAGGKEPLWSYAMSAYFGWDDEGKIRSKDFHGRHYRSFKRADRYLLFAELPFAEVKEGAVDQSGSLSGAAADPILQYPGCRKSNNEAIGFNHKDGKERMGHVCFADGHVEKLRAPKTGSVGDLTKWLCRPVDDDGNDFDISFDGKAYKKNTASAQ